MYTTKYYREITRDRINNMMTIEVNNKHKCSVFFHLLDYLSSNVLSLYCIFDVQNLVLCLNREFIKIIDYKIMLKLQCKNTFYSVFVGKKNVGKTSIKIEQELTLE
jgi:hypothetical protein